MVMTYKITREITTELFTYVIISHISYINQLQCNKVAPSRFAQALLRVDNIYNRSVSLWMITAADTDSLNFKGSRDVIENYSRRICVTCETGYNYARDICNWRLSIVLSKEISVKHDRDRCDLWIPPRLSLLNHSLVIECLRAVHGVSPK